MRTARLPIATLVLFLASGCFLPTWPELQYTRTKPLETELVGSWRPTAKTISDLRRRGRYAATDHELNLRPDHTFTMRNMPDWWRNGFGESHGQFDSGNGTWELSSANNVWQIWVVWLHFSQFPGSASSGATPIHLCHQRPPYLIFIGVGDPDEGEGMLFERSKT
jgi:hypothetical protein